MRTTPCDRAARQGRVRKAEQFGDAAAAVADLADDSDDVADAVVSLCVLAGIAAADVICCARLGKHAQGQDHHEAVALLQSADAASARSLSALLGLKTKAEYSAVGSSGKDVLRSERAAAHLLEAARRAHAATG